MHLENRRILKQPAVVAAQVQGTTPATSILNTAVARRLTSRPVAVFAHQTTGLPTIPKGFRHTNDMCKNLCDDLSYVSFRLAAWLPNTHPWGGYMSLGFRATAEADLISNGCPSPVASEIAFEIVRSAISLQYLLDRACLDLNELFVKSTNGPRPHELFPIALRFGADTCRIGLRKGAADVSAKFGAQSAEAIAVASTFGSLNYRPREFPRLCREVFCDLLEYALGPFLGPDGLYRLARLFPVYSNERQCFPDIELPISFY